MYLLIEQFLNGTVTLEVRGMGIDSQTFEDAKQKIKSSPKMQELKICIDSDSEFVYTSGEREEEGRVRCVGTMKSDILKII